MSNEHKYEVVQTSPPPTYWPCWTVVEYVDGVCKGGDRHWLYEATARLAKRLYEEDAVWHNARVQAILDEIRRRGWGQFL